MDDCSRSLLAPGLPWPWGSPGPDPHIAVHILDGVLTLLIAIELATASAELGDALATGLYTIGFTLDPPRLSGVIVDDYILAKGSIGFDRHRLREFSRQVRSAKVRQVIVVEVRHGLITRMVKTATKDRFWRLVGRSARHPRRDPFLDHLARNLVYPPTRDAEPVCEADGGWRPKGWRL